MLVHNNSYGGLSFSVSGTAVGLLADILQGVDDTREVRSFVLTANDGDLRYIVGSSDPSSSYGHILAQGEPTRFSGDALPLVRLIAADGLGPVNATYSDLAYNSISQ